MTTKTQKSKIKEQKLIASKEETTEKTVSKPLKSQKEPFGKTQGEPQTMDELLAQSGGITLVMKKGETVNGVVVSASAREVLVDIGRKSFGIVAEWELEQVKEYAASLKVGDKITAQVINPENDAGFATLSLRKTSTERRWTILENAKENGEDIDVTPLEMAKGGLLVEWQSLRGFIPATQLDSESSSNPGMLIGRRMKVKVLEVDQAMNRMVLSQKASSLGISPKILKDRLDKIKPNDSMKGVVSGIAPFGLFVDIEGLEGLVHISEIAWEKVTAPGDFFKVGVKVEVMVLDVNQKEGKLNLSIKRLTPDPWKNILDRYPVDANVKGKAVRSAPYGIFVSLETGIEGLIHISKITAGNEPKIGEDIECIVENVDPIKRKISLTLVPTAKPVGYR